MGSRYGGLKQLEPVGPAGEILLDYSVFDALRAGFGSVVFVTRPEIASSLRAFVERRYGTRVPVALALQRLSDVPKGVPVPHDRVTPWGTGQAVLAAESCVSANQPFVVANADDFYGAPAFAAAATFLAHASTSSTGGPPVCSLVGYRLEATLSAAGGVNRAICRTDANGWLETLDEVLAIRRDERGRLEGVGDRGPVHPDENTLVSMNLWGFTPAVFATLRRGFQEFLREPDAASREYRLPTAIEHALRRRELRVRVLDPESAWCGLTYPEDREPVRAFLRRAIAAGEYPSALWSL
jgi:hypothetical protein